MIYLHRFSLAGVLLAATLGSTASAIAAPAPDADLYYRRTHGGARPVTPYTEIDHAREQGLADTASLAPAALSSRGAAVALQSVDPTNLGMGEWIWHVTTSRTNLGLSTNQQLMDYLAAKGCKWVTVKCGDGTSTSSWTQFTSTLVTQAHNSGLKIFGWAYCYGTDPSGEANVPLTNCLNLGADGFIIDAEGQYEALANNATAATTYCQKIRASYPTTFLAHAPFPYVNLHGGFPYVTFGNYCDAVMPQCYWDEINTQPGTGATLTPILMVSDLNSKWTAAQNGWPAASVKPIVPIGQGWVSNSRGSGSEIWQFFEALKQTNTPATSGGYKGASFWDVEEHTSDMWSAVGSISIGGTPTHAAATKATSLWADWVTPSAVTASPYSFPTANTATAAWTATTEVRSIAVSSTNGHVYVGDRTNGHVDIVNGATGAVLGALSQGSIPASNFVIYAGDCDSAGVIYWCSLGTVYGNVTVWRWANESATPTKAIEIASGGTLGGAARSISVTGSGTSTMIALGGDSDGKIYVLTTADGATFSLAQTIAPATTLFPTNASVTGLAFGPGGTELYACIASSDPHFIRVTFSSNWFLSYAWNPGVLIYGGTFNYGLRVANRNGHKELAFMNYTASHLQNNGQPTNNPVPYIGAYLFNIDSPSDPYLTYYAPVPTTVADSGGTGGVALDPTNNRLFYFRTNNGLAAWSLPGASKVENWSMY